MLKIIIVLKLLAFLVLVTPSIVPLRRQRLRFTTTTSSTTTEKPYVFEGVDYDLAPESIREEHNDCDGEFLKCIRRKTYFAPTCAYDWRVSWYEDYYAICEVDLQNCQYRVKKKYGGVYGNTYQTDAVFFNGEEKDCKYYYVRSRNALEMDRLYTGLYDPPYRSKPRPEKFMRVHNVPSFMGMFSGFNGTTVLPNLSGLIGTNMDLNSTYFKDVK